LGLIAHDEGSRRWLVCSEASVIHLIMRRPPDDKLGEITSAGALEQDHGVKDSGITHT
jgi:hypothetical protein